MANPAYDGLNRPQDVSGDEIAKAMSASKVKASAENFVKAFDDVSVKMKKALSSVEELADLEKFVKVVNDAVKELKKQIEGKGKSKSETSGIGGKQQKKLLKDIANIHEDILETLDITSYEWEDIAESISKSKNLTEKEGKIISHNLRNIKHLSKTSQENFKTLVKEYQLSNDKLATAEKMTEALKKQETIAKKQVGYYSQMKKNFAEAKEDFDTSKIGQTLSLLKDVAGAAKKVTDGLAAMAGVDPFDIEKITVDAFKDNAKYTKEMSASLYRVHGLTGDVVSDTNKMQTSFYMTGKDLTDIYRRTGQTSEVYRKQLLKNLNRGIGSQTKLQKITDIGLRSARLIGSEAEATADTYSDWYMHLQLNTQQMATLARNTSQAGRITGVVGDNLLDAVKSARELAKLMRFTGVYTDKAAKDLVQGFAAAKKYGVEEAFGEIAKAMSGPTAFFGADMKTQAFLQQAATGRGIDNSRLMRGELNREEKKSLAGGMEDLIFQVTGARSLDDLKNVDMGSLMAFKAMTGRDAGEMMLAVKSFKESTMSAKDKLDELTKEYNKSTTSAKRRGELEKEIAAQAAVAKREEVSEKLEGLKGLTGPAFQKQASSVLDAAMQKNQAVIAGLGSKEQQIREELAKKEKEIEGGANTATNRAQREAMKKQLESITNIRTTGVSAQTAKIQEARAKIASATTPEEVEALQEELGEIVDWGDIEEITKGLDKFTSVETAMQEAVLRAVEILESIQNTTLSKMSADFIAKSIITAGIAQTILDKVTDILGYIVGIATALGAGAWLKNMLGGRGGTPGGAPGGAPGGSVPKGTPGGGLANILGPAVLFAAATYGGIKVKEHAEGVAEKNRESTASTHQTIANMHIDFERDTVSRKKAIEQLNVDQINDEIAKRKKNIAHYEAGFAKVPKFHSIMDKWTGRADQWNADMKGFQEAANNENKIITELMDKKQRLETAAKAKDTTPGKSQGGTGTPATTAPTSSPALPIDSLILMNKEMASYEKETSANTDKIKANTDTSNDRLAKIQEHMAELVKLMKIPGGIGTPLDTGTNQKPPTPANYWSRSQPGSSNPQWGSTTSTMGAK